MEFLNKTGLLLLLGIVPLVLLYILKVKRERRRVPSSMLWVASQRDFVAKHPFRRLLPEMALILQLLALLALAFALGRPASRGRRVFGDHLAIVVDTSASMGARVENGSGRAMTRLDRAKRTTEDVLGAMQPGADALLIEAGRDPRLLSGLERDKQRLRAMVGSLQVQDVEGDLGTAVMLAADRLKGLGGLRKVVVVTDGALAHSDPITISGVEAAVLSVADDLVENAAIVRLDVRGGVDPVTRRDQAQIFTLVKNFGAKARDVFVTATLAGAADPIASRRLLLAANAKEPVVLTFEPSRQDEGRGLIVSLSPGDPLRVDDVAYGRVPGRRRMPVVLATSEPNSWFARALGADPDVDLQAVSASELAAINVDPLALVLLEGVCPTVLPGLDVLVVGPPPGVCAGVEVQAEVKNPQITSWEANDSRLRFLSLDGVHLAKATPLVVRGAGGSLIRAQGISIGGDASTPGRRITLLGFDVAESDWPLKASFVLFVRNLVEDARQHRVQGTVAGTRTGDPLRIPVPPGVERVHVDGPHVQDQEFPVRGGLVVMPFVTHAGLYEVRWTSPRIGKTIVAANLTSEFESDLRARPVLLRTQEGPAQEKKEIDAHQEWGTWLAAVATLALLLDLWWYTRRSRLGRGVKLAADRTPSSAHARSKVRV